MVLDVARRGRIREDAQCIPSTAPLDKKGCKAEVHLNAGLGCKVDGVHHLLGCVGILFCVQMTVVAADRYLVSYLQHLKKHADYSAIVKK